MTSSIISKARAYTDKLLEYCKDYPYHNPAHTQWVFDRATYLGIVENIDKKDLEDLQIAALFHDTGFVEQYEKNEHIGARIARKWLEEQWYPENRIEKIESIIMATVLFSRPRTKIECIIQDADLDNIWTKEEFFYSQQYLKELRTIGKVKVSDCVFWQFVYRLLTKYKFHTHTARSERQEQQRLDIMHTEKYLEMLGCDVPSIHENVMNEIQ